MTPSEHVLEGRTACICGLIGPHAPRSTGMYEPGKPAHHGGRPVMCPGVPEGREAVTGSDTTRQPEAPPTPGVPSDDELRELLALEGIELWKFHRVAVPRKVFAMARELLEARAILAKEESVIVERFHRAWILAEDRCGALESELAALKSTMPCDECDDSPYCVTHRARWDGTPSCDAVMARRATEDGK